MHISAFGDALRTPDLRRKIFFTIGLLAVYRLTGHREMLEVLQSLRPRSRS